jgi:hypothetical protein
VIQKLLNDSKDILDFADKVIAFYQAQWVWHYAGVGVSPILVLFSFTSKFDKVKSIY